MVRMYEGSSFEDERLQKIKLEAYLKKTGVDKDLPKLILVLAEAVKKISKAVRTADVGKTGSTNVYGEEQLALDVLADRVIANHLKSCDPVYAYASEELAELQKVAGSAKGKFIVCYDPLDGSSLVDVNLAVGSIFGIYQTGGRQGKDLIGRTGEEQKAALFAVYGPRTTLVLTVRKGVREFTLSSENEFLQSSEENLVVKEEGKMFAPGNLRACAFDERYFWLLEHWVKKEYTLRYSGGMVPDINQILLKGKGIFTYPPYQKMPRGKLRLLFECAPMALLMEQAGGAATDGKERILKQRIEELSQRTPILIGGKKEVEIAQEYLSRKLT